MNITMQKKYIPTVDEKNQDTQSSRILRSRGTELWGGQGTSGAVVSVGRVWGAAIWVTE